MKLLRRLPLLLVLALVAAGLSLPLGLAYERGLVYDEGSSLRSDGDGTRALFLVLEETGRRPVRVRRAAPREAKGVLLSVWPREDTRDDELLDWVRAGNVLVLADALDEERAGEARPLPSPSPSSSPSPRPSPSPRQRSLREALGLGRERPALVQALGLQLEAAATPAELSQDSPLRDVLRAWDVHEQARHYWRLRPRDARVLLGTAERPVLIEFGLGKGQVVALSDAAWLTNAGLPQRQRLALALQLLLKPGLPILFDEYRHGLAEQPGLAYVLARYGLLPTAFAALGLLALVAWRTTPAEAPPPPEGGEPVVVRDSLVEARAGIYARTLRPAQAVSLIEHDLRAGLGEALGSRAHSWRDLRQRLSERRPALAGRLDALQKELSAARSRPDAPLASLVPLTQRVARLLAQV